VSLITDVRFELLNPKFGRARLPLCTHVGQNA